MQSYTMERIEKVLSIIQPEHFDMRHFLFVPPSEERRGGVETTAGNAVQFIAEAHCGTVCCFAGWTAVAFPPATEREKREDIEDYARNVLGLALDEAGDLFYASFVTLESLPEHIEAVLGVYPRMPQAEP